MVVNEVKFQTARRLTDGDRAKFIRIYEESFPREERDEADSLLSSIASGDRRCDLAYASGELVALSVLIQLSVRDVQFLEYFAVDSRYRSQGIGSRFLIHLIDELRSSTPRTPGVAFEVEPPHHAVGEERRLRQRRVDFYARNGAVLVECAPEYRAPNLANEGSVAYLLMWLPVGSTIPRLEGSLLRECVTAVLTESYALGLEDPFVTKVVAQLRC